MGAVVDSSVLIPLSWVGRLELLTETFDEIATTDDVYDEVLTDGKRGVAALETFLTDVRVRTTPSEAARIAELEGIAVADASVILTAEEDDELLVANDKGLIEVARSHGVECWWVTTLLLKCAKEGTVTGKEAEDVLYELVDEGMNLHPKVYVQVQRKLRELGS